MKLINEIGNTYGLWTVLRRADDYVYGTGDKAPAWLCSCCCGILQTILGTNLRSGNSKGCNKYNNKFIKGHKIQSDTKIECGLSAKRALYATYKKNAKKRGYVFDLEFDFFISLCQLPCFYCDSAPKNIFKPISTKHGKVYFGNGNFIYNGLDRIDNNKGYYVDNSRPCCWICNNAKSNMTEREFKEWLQKIHDRNFSFQERHLSLEPTCLI